MSIHKIKKIIAYVLAFVFIGILMPLKVSGEVAPINDIEDKLEGITEEEKAILEKLFTIQQVINDTRQQQADITDEIAVLKTQMTTIEDEITKKQKSYDDQLDLLKQVLVTYQRGGPASYLEILLNADNLSDFLKSLNILKDISHNVNNLLISLDVSKQELQEEKALLDEKTRLLEQTKKKLEQKLEEEEALQEEQENYLASLQEDREFYEEQLGNVVQMWTDCKALFSDLVTEITKVIGDGHYTVDDLNLEYGIFTVAGYLEEGTFNSTLRKYSSMTETIFRFEEDKVIIEVPDKHLVLEGNFVIGGESAIRYEVVGGTFYDLPLEATSIEELFQKGPLLIDFKKIAGDMVIIDFKINEVQSREGTLNFVIKPQY